MNRARPFLLCALPAILASCSSLATKPTASLPPRVDCAAFDSPPIATPALPALAEKDPTILWMAILGWESYAEGLIGQRYDTAKCLAVMQKAGVIR